MRVLPCRRENHGFFYLPKGLSAEAQSQRQPTISFYTNYSYLIAGSLLFRDMKMMGDSPAGAAARTMLYAKGATEDQAMAYLQPIVIDTHPLNNPWLNYSVYLCNTLIPGSTHAINIYGYRLFNRCGNQGSHCPRMATNE